MTLISQILKKLAPRTPAAKRERFVPFLEEATARYSINTELRLAAFLATCCFESAYFRTTVEYRATKPGKAKRLQDKYWGTGFYGRGLIQLTHKRNYEAFNKAIWGDWHPITDKRPDVLHNPDAVAEPMWAVESACWFWQENNLNRYADKGQFFAIQGLVNRGDAKKEALEYPTRLSLYDAALRAIPDDYSAAAPATQDLPANEDDDSIPSPESASKPSEQQQNLLDRATAPLIAVKAKFDTLGVNPGDISKSSAVTTILTKIGGWLVVLAGFVADRPVWFGIGAVLIIVAVLYLASAKRNATDRVINGVK